jgi:membrane protease YdiL (CAAX protease family)
VKVAMMPSGSLPIRRNPAAKVAVFLVLTLLLAAGPYVMMARTGSTRDYALAWMWGPGIAALGTRLIFGRNIRGLGWNLPSVGYFLIGFAIPLGYSLLIYSTVWIVGLGAFHGQPPARLLLFATFGLLVACFAAFGEELGWRGLLLPELTRLVSFSKAATITGAVWAVWHFPAVLFADYHSQAPRWLDTLSLTAAIIGLSFFTARLRLSSGSIWPCVVWHGAHNLFVQQIFYDLTIQSDMTHYFIDDFGIGVLLASWTLGAGAWIAQRRSERLPVAARSQAA